MDSEPVPNVRRRKLERAVIEAAEAWAADEEVQWVMSAETKVNPAPSLLRIFLAVEAMQAARSE